MIDLEVSLVMSAHLRAGPFRALKMRPVRQEGCPQSVESAVLRAFEDASRTPGSLFEHGTHIPYRRMGFLVRRASENASHLVVRSTG